ncbi:SDR family oxidoreductase [Sediminitomix flava]|uniref:NADP-dependent 3-hydroxy acid dehydrogenase YdfG n=1 Tax=Sediminitomix flava TaxID=379075 RepID=A0A315ZB72_SEDFL|nr:SDR family oxidoreductase [Sediminitomix flava]PWJ42409.1 NADP-dependent 3-hydroxy acid dehydrogenase YdfG [Sediminitomix flava]
MKKTILITGSSTGIGRSSAIKFQKEGWNVVATMRSPEKETELDQLENVLVTKLDVLDLQSIENAINEGIEHFGKIDVVLNNAGYGLAGTFESASRESLMRQFGVNVQGLFDVTQKALPHFRANKDGMFINISSIGGKMTFPVMPVYHATKHAVEGFTESLAYEMEAIGVKVKIVEPGAIATDFGGRSMDFQHDESLTEYNEFVAGVMGKFQEMMDPTKMSTPELVADVIYTAATDGTDTLRYRAGADAEQLLNARQAMSDTEFKNMMKTQLGLA